MSAQRGLPPVADRASRVLILGSLPGRQSLDSGQYYSNPRNHFWRILCGALGEPVPAGYEEKLALLHRRHIALWDVIASARRVGSLDSAIREPEPNSITWLLDRCPEIGCILLNGSKAAQIYRRQREILLPAIPMPSTSSVGGRYVKTEEEKLALWKKELYTHLNNRS